MAHLSGDPHMIEAFQSGADIHAATAAKIYGIPVEKVTSDMRRKAKTANFGIIYGISVFGLAERLGIPRSESKELIDGYFSTYPRIKEYMEESIKVAKEKGYVETIFKRKRFLSDINSHNAVVRGYAERNAINAPIQGSAADIIKLAMVRIYERFEEEGLKSKMILQVHPHQGIHGGEHKSSQGKRIRRDHFQAQAFPFGYQLTQRRRTRLCRAKRNQCPYPRERRRYHQTSDGTHLRTL
jgi:DNA polymerase-1